MQVSSSYDFRNEINSFVNLVKSQFVSRTTLEGSNSGKDFKGARLESNVIDKVLWLTLTAGEEVHHVTVPVPFIEDGITFIKFNEVKRAVCDHYDVMSERRISYLNAVQTIFMGDFSPFILTVPAKRTMFVQQLAYSILNGNTSVIVYSLQKAINELINKMPLHETNMNSWMMNNRLMLIDPIFDGLDDPNDKLAYQIEKNKRYFNNGWTSIGLSDGTLADKNYILAEDLRNYTPFGKSHHNPQRNLYSTLGMKGDEYPRIRSNSIQRLMDKGIARKGWNLTTAFADIPDTFEDQIMVDESHKNLAVHKERRFQCFGDLLVSVGQRIKYGQALSVDAEGKQELFKVKADSAWISKIKKAEISVGGARREVYNVIVTLRRKLKDGTKITNMHGNKGVIRLKKLGYAINHKTGEKIKLDVIVSAKTIGKRKNHGQVLELLYNNILDHNHKSVEIPTISNKSKWCDDSVGVVSKYRTIKTQPDPMVLDDNYTVLPEQLADIEAQHIEMGFKEGAVLECDTYAGKVDAICGKVFWGVVKDVEDQLWDKDATTITNGKDIRTAGLKLSPVEFKAIETVFGKDNAVLREVLSHTQGTDLIQESIKVLQGKRGVLPVGVFTVLPKDVKEVDQSGGTLFTEEALKATMADEHYRPDGFLLQLPVQYQVALPVKEHADIYEGAPVFNEQTLDKEAYRELFTTDKLVVPGGILRRSWKHGSGLYGMSEVSTLLNNIVSFCHRMAAEPEETRHVGMLYRAIFAYYSRISASLCSKRGDIASYAMSVRYPYSAKAVATLSNELPEHTVQIHRDMAETLGVNNGDCVLVERFPCLGFMGVRVQKVAITDDPMCKFTIRASGNSLVSANLDFDGDVIYIAAFHTKEARAELEREWTTPNPAYWDYVHKLNIRKGEPFVHSMCLKDYAIEPFPAFTADTQAHVVGKLTGVKAHTGPVIALAYNLMRITENSDCEIDQKTEAGIEMFIEKAGQSVFEQKHGGQSLHEIVIDAVCTANADALIKEGFEADTAKFICNIIRKKAAAMNIHDLVDFHENKGGKKGSNIINKIVRNENEIYFASRSRLEGCTLLEKLAAPAVDLPSRIYHLIMSGKYDNVRNILDKAVENKMMHHLSEETKDVCKALFKCIDNLAGVKRETFKVEREDLWQLISTKSCSVEL